MKMKGRLRRIEQAVLGDALVSIKQVDGSTYRISRDEALGSLFDHWAGTVEAEHPGGHPPDPPPALVAVANAKDRERALSHLLGNYEHFLAVDVEALIQEGELVPRELYRVGGGGR